MARVLYCSHCQAEYFTDTGPMRSLCYICGRPTIWTTMAPVPDEPRPAWELSQNDRRFLRSIKIDPKL